MSSQFEEGGGGGGIGEGGAMMWGLISGGGGHRSIYVPLVPVTSLQIHSLSAKVSLDASNRSHRSLWPFLGHQSGRLSIVTMFTILPFF